jgi:hypothetical protein
MLLSKAFLSDSQRPTKAHYLILLQWICRGFGTVSGVIWRVATLLAEHGRGACKQAFVDEPTVDWAGV